MLSWGDLNVSVKTSRLARIETFGFIPRNGKYLTVSLLLEREQPQAFPGHLPKPSWVVIVHFLTMKRSPSDHTES